MADIDKLLSPITIHHRGRATEVIMPSDPAWLKTNAECLSYGTSSSTVDAYRRDVGALMAALKGEATP